MKMYKISFAESRLAPVWKQAEVPWEKLVENLTKTLITEETYEEYLKMSKDEQGKIKDHGGFVGGALREGKRRRGYVLCHSLITLDLDDCPADIIDDIDCMCPYRAIIYSTHKHSKRNPRLRMVLPLSRECSEEEYEPLARMVASKCLSSMDPFDKTTYEPTRLMYFPTTSTGGDFYGKEHPGKIVNVDEELACYKDWHNVDEWPKSSKEETLRKKEIKDLDDPAKKKNIIGAFCSVYGIEEAIANFLTDVYEPGTISGRYTYIGGSTSNGARVYNNSFLYSDHQTDPVNGQGSVNSFDLVRIHKYGHLDVDVPKGTRASSYPSFKACEKWALTIPEVAEALTEIKAEARAERATKAANEITGEITVKGEYEPWMAKLIMNPQTGRYADTAENYEIILNNDKNLKHLIGYNRFSTNDELIGKAPWTRADDAKITFNDDDTNQLYCYISKTYKIRKKSEMLAAVSGWVAKNAFDPVREYIETAKWDGVPRIERYFIDYLGADDNEYVRTVTRKMFVAAVARVYRPGCKFDYMVTLVGKQGIGKSYACKNLAGPNGEWFQDSISGSTILGDDKSYDKVQGVWIIELGELAALKKNEREQVKLFISKQADTYRKAFHTRNESYPRRCIFIGTTNDDLFLNDATGARRFLIIDCHGHSKKKPWDIKPEEVNQLWAEAKVLFDKGENIMDLSTVAETALEQQESHSEINEYLGEVEQFVDVKIPSNWSKKDIVSRTQFIRGNEEHRASIIKDDNVTEDDLVLRNKVCVSEFFCEFQGHDRNYKDGYASRKINEALSKLGWIRETSPSNYGPYGKQRGWRRPKIVDKK